MSVEMEYARNLLCVLLQNPDLSISDIIDLVRNRFADNNIVLAGDVVIPDDRTEISAEIMTDRGKVRVSTKEC